MVSSWARWSSLDDVIHGQDVEFILKQFYDQSNLISVAIKFFAKGAATGIGFDSQLMREIGSLPPDKVTISLLISAQVNIKFWYFSRIFTIFRPMFWNFSKRTGVKHICRPFPRKNVLKCPFGKVVVKCYSIVIWDLVKWQMHGVDFMLLSNDQRNSWNAWKYQKYD